MSVVNDITKLRDNHIILVVVLLALVGPGIGTLLVFFPHAVIELDVFKILLLSACLGLGLSLPLALVFLVRYSQKLAGTDGRLATCLTVSSITTLITTAVVLALAYWLSWSFQTYLIIVSSVCVVAWPLVLSVLPALLKRGLI